MLRLTFPCALCEFYRLQFRGERPVRVERVGEVEGRGWRRRCSAGAIWE
jgi:hypothetical protein